MARSLFPMAKKLQEEFPAKKGQLHKQLQKAIQKYIKKDLQSTVFQTLQSNKGWNKEFLEEGTPIRAWVGLAEYIQNQSDESNKQSYRGSRCRKSRKRVSGRRSTRRRSKTRRRVQKKSAKSKKP